MISQWRAEWFDEVESETARVTTTLEDTPGRQQAHRQRMREATQLAAAGWLSGAVEILSRLSEELNRPSSQRPAVPLTSSGEYVSGDLALDREPEKTEPTALKPAETSQANERDHAEAVVSRETPSKPFPRAFPYVTGAPLKANSRAVFVGRSDIFEFVDAHLGPDTPGPQRNILALTGLRRMGKTSVLQQIKSDRNGILGDRVPVLIDFASLGAGTIGDILRRLCEDMLNSIPHKQRRIDPPDINRFDRDAISAFKFYIDRLEGAYPDGLVFLWDEFQWVDDRVASGVLDRDIYMVFRDILQRHDTIDVVIFGNMRLASLSHGSDLSFYGSALVRRIGFLDTPSAVHLITHPVQDWMLFTDMSIEKIVYETRCHPLLLQHFCQVICDFAKSQSLRTVDADLVDHLIPRVLSVSELVFNQLWRQELVDSQRATLVSLLRTGGVEKRLADDIRVLIELELLSATPTGFAPTIPLFERWLRQTATDGRKGANSPR